MYKDYERTSLRKNKKKIVKTQEKMLSLTIDQKKCEFTSVEQYFYNLSDWQKNEDCPLQDHEEKF